METINIDSSLDIGFDNLRQTRSPKPDFGPCHAIGAQA